MTGTMATPTLGTLLQQFFIEYLMQQREASARTITTYRDSFKLLLSFAERQLNTRPADLTLTDLDATLIVAFLRYLETERHNSARTRNARFAAIRSFMHYVGLRHPQLLAYTQTILAIPMKRFERPLIGFLTREHIEALITAPDETTWSGERDRVMFATLYNTGAGL